MNTEYIKMNAKKDAIVIKSILGASQILHI